MHIVARHELNRHIRKPLHRLAPDLSVIFRNVRMPTWHVMPVRGPSFARETCPGGGVRRRTLLRRCFGLWRFLLTEMS